MAYKKIICLANSTKIGCKCVACKTIDTKEWIRPVSEEGRLTRTQIKYANGKLPELLDIIRIPYKKLQPTIYQPENVLISEEQWECLEKFPKDKLDDLCDKPKEIFINQDRRDRIEVGFFEKNRPGPSLLLVKPMAIKLLREDYGTRKRLKASFIYNDLEYNLWVRDPNFEEKYAGEKEGSYKLDSKDVCLCISLAAPHNDGYCYKLVASIIAA